MLALATGIIASMGLASPTAAAQWRYYNLDNDRLWDAAVMDANGNGCQEDQWFDTDNDGRWDTNIYNTVGSECFLEVVTFDLNEDGRLEGWAQDVDGRFGFDRFYVDSNRDGRFEGPYAMSAAGLSTSYSVVGGLPRLDGPSGLVVFIAGLTGNVVR